jgi:hypothetical protein
VSDQTHHSRDFRSGGTVVRFRHCKRQSLPRMRAGVGAKESVLTISTRRASSIAANAAGIGAQHIVLTISTLGASDG